MSDYFFYDLNKKMADLANKQQLAETAQAAPVRPTPSALRTQLNERDLGKHNNATTGFAALAKKTGGGEKGAKIAGAQLAKMRAKGQVEEGSKPDFLDLDKDGNRKEPMKSAARGAKKAVDESTCPSCKCSPCKCDSMDESALQAAFGKKKYGDQGMKALQKAGRDHAGDATMNKIRNRYDKYDESMTDEGNAFSGAVVKAKKDGIQPGEQISVGGKQYKLRETDATPQDVGSYEDEVKKVNAPQRKASAPVMPPKKTMPPKKPAMYPPQAIDDPVKEGGVPMTAKQKSFAKLAPPVDKITFADKIVGAKKEVDEMLGDVAANAMKNAVGKMRGRNRDMEESFLDDEPTSRRSSTGGRIDTSEPGVTRHRAVKGNYSGAAHDAGSDDEPTGMMGRRKVGAGMGKKIGAKINRGTSKLMTKEGDMPEDMIQSQDPGEYDQEGDMAKNDIHTMVRHAQDLEKMLSDNENLPEWVQKKINLASDYIQTAADYLASEKEKNGSSQEMDEESTSKRDNRAEKAGRKVAKDIEYDEKKKDGIHGKRRGSEDSKAEKAGNKVTKDIEYDEKKNKKKKEVDETTTSGSVATGGAAPKSSGGHSYGKGIYDSLNRQLENMISESMNINMSMNNDEHGGPRRSLTVTATDEDATMLADLLKMAGMGSGDDQIYAMTSDDSGTDAIHDMDHDHGDEPCPDCGMSDCGCDDTMDEDRWGAEHPPKLPYDMTVTAPGGVDVNKSGDSWVYKSNEPGGRITATIPAKASNKMFPNTNVDETYGDTDATQNEPDYPTDEVGTDNAMMYSGGLDGPKSTGQTTTPVNAAQKDRMGHAGDNELRRMMEIAGLR